MNATAIPKTVPISTISGVPWIHSSRGENEKVQFPVCPRPRINVKWRNSSSGAIHRYGQVIIKPIHPVNNQGNPHPVVYISFIEKEWKRPLEGRDRRHQERRIKGMKRAFTFTEQAKPKRKADRKKEGILVMRDRCLLRKKTVSGGELEKSPCWCRYGLSVVPRCLLKAPMKNRRLSPKRQASGKSLMLKKK